MKQYFSSMKRENCRDGAGTQPFSFSHIKGQCVASSSLVPSFLCTGLFQIQEQEKNRVTSSTGYQLGSFSDVLRRINDLHLQLQTEKWRALQGPFSPAGWLLGFCLRLPSSSVAARLTGHTSSRALLLSFCSISTDCTIFHPLSHIISGFSPFVSSTLCSQHGLSLPFSFTSQRHK